MKNPNPARPGSGYSMFSLHVFWFSNAGAIYEIARNYHNCIYKF